MRASGRRPSSMEGGGLGVAKPNPRALFHPVVWGLQTPLSSSGTSTCGEVANPRVVIFPFTLRKLIFRVEVVG